MGVEFVRSPWVRWGMIAAGVLAILAIFHLRLPETFPIPLLARFFNVPPATGIGWLVDLFGFAFMFFVGLAVISQFALPVRTWDERVQAVSRIFDFTFGSHGPVVFVKEGNLVASETELKRGGAGVVLVDSTSAVVLDRGARFSRAHGPGITFLQPGERIRATLDLRRQSRSQPVAAQTKDGIEVKTTIGAVFGLAASEKLAEELLDRLAPLTGVRKMKQPYPFDPKSAFLAIYGTATGRETPVIWTELPVYVAAERFRVLLARQALDDLFRPADAKTFLMEDFVKRLTDDVRGEEVLRDRGIEVYSVSVGAFELPREVLRQRLDSWEAPWEKRAQIALAAGEVHGEMIKQRAQHRAEGEVANVVRAALKSEGEMWTPEDKDRTMRRILGALRHLASARNRVLHSGDALRIVSMLNLPKEAAESLNLSRLLEEGHAEAEAEEEAETDSAPGEPAEDLGDEDDGPEDEA
jgi:regulator of protease activity HflC (stomatin/prohibitin superfamily)